MSLLSRLGERIGRALLGESAPLVEPFRPSAPSLPFKTASTTTHTMPVSAPGAIDAEFVEVRQLSDSQAEGAARLAALQQQVELEQRLLDLQRQRRDLEAMAPPAPQTLALTAPPTLPAQLRALMKTPARFPAPRIPRHPVSTGDAKTDAEANRAHDAEVARLIAASGGEFGYRATSTLAASSRTKDGTHGDFEELLARTGHLLNPHLVQYLSAYYPEVDLFGLRVQTPLVGQDRPTDFTFKPRHMAMPRDKLGEALRGLREPENIRALEDSMAAIGWYYYAIFGAVLAQRFFIGTVFLPLAESAASLEDARKVLEGTDSREHLDFFGAAKRGQGIPFIQVWPDEPIS